MSNPLEFLEYTFMIDTSNTFSSIYEFEKLLTEFLATRGLEAKNITSVHGAPAKRIIFITKKQEIVPPAEPKPVGRPLSMKGQIAKLTDRKLRKPAIDFMKKK